MPHVGGLLALSSAEQPQDIDLHSTVKQISSRSFRRYSEGIVAQACEALPSRSYTIQITTYQKCWECRWGCEACQSRLRRQCASSWRHF